MNIENATRVFDCLEILLNKYQKPEVLFYKENEEWLSYSAEDIHYYAYKLAESLLNIGISFNDGKLKNRSKVLIIADPSPEWIIIDLAIQLCGAISVPVYTNITDKELIYILQQIDTQIAFVGSKNLYERITAMQKKVPSIQYIVTLKEVTNAISWKKFISNDNDQKLREEINLIAKKIKEDDIFTIIYTSGTTGLPKGVLLSHKNLMANIKSVLRTLPEINEYKTTFTFLPLNHVYERLVNYAFIYAGTRLHYGEGLDKIAQNIKEVRPHIFTAVPRVVEKIYQAIMEKINAGNIIVRILGNLAIHCAKAYNINGHNSFIYKVRLWFWRKMVLDKWRKAFGNRVEFLVVGSSSCSPELITLFTAARVQLLEGYGLTEMSPVVSVNLPNKKDKYLGTVGLPLDCVEVKIAEDGEILCKGDTVMKGYYLDDQQTKEVIDENGWFYTGDIGTIIDHKFLKITDRKKELFKTSNGKYVAPQPIENKIKLSPLVDQAMVWGDKQKFPVVLIVPNLTNLKKFAQKLNIDYLTTQQLFENLQIHNAYKQILIEVNKELSAEQAVKRFKLLEIEWTVNTGELTPTLKLKRRVIEQRYKQELLNLYKNFKV